MGKIYLYIYLTLSSPVVSNGYTSKFSGPHWSNPPFLILSNAAIHGIGRIYK